MTKSGRIVLNVGGGQPLFVDEKGKERTRGIIDYNFFQMASPKRKSWDEFGKGNNAPPKKVVKKRSPPVFHKHSFVRSFMSASNFLELIWTSKDSQPENDPLIAFLTRLIDACDSQATSLGLVLAPLRRVSKASSEYVPNAEESLNGTTYWRKYFVRCYQTDSRSLDERRIGLQHVATVSYCIVVKSKSVDCNH